jgi:hypothetical protein
MSKGGRNMETTAPVSIKRHPEKAQAPLHGRVHEGEPGIFRPASDCHFSFRTPLNGVALDLTFLN